MKNKKKKLNAVHKGLALEALAAAKKRGSEFFKKVGFKDINTANPSCRFRDGAWPSLPTTVPVGGHASVAVHRLKTFNLTRSEK